MGIAGNKGGVGIRFRFYETDICFVNCHFASGDGQTQRRNEDYQTIESRMTFNDGPSYSFTDRIWYTPTTLASAASATISSSTSTPSPTSNSWKINEHDIVFWFGDMNYRIAHGNEQVRKALLDKSTIPLREKDQLRCEMKLNRIFIGYAESVIEFSPTYKYDLGTDTYDSSEKARIPSWTDRILYHARRTKVRADGDIEIATVQPIDYIAAKQIRFSDHRPVSSLYLVTMKSVRDDERANRIREELIRQIDREENDAIPVIEVHPRAPAIIHNNLRYLDQISYSLDITNIGECRCTVNIRPPSIPRPKMTIKERGIVEDPFFECLSLVPSSPYSLEPGDKQTINISFQMKSKYIWLFGKQLNEILILHVTNGADTFITLDITLDMGPFGLAFSQFPPTLYDSEKKQYAYSVHSADHLIEMKNDPPTLYLALIECLKTRQDLNLFQIFNSEIQDSLDLHPIRNQIYEHNYHFDSFSTIEVFMILLHLLQSLPEPLVSREIQDQIFFTTNHSNRSSYLPSGGSIQSHIPSNQYVAPSQQDMNKAVSIIFERLKPKERNLFLRFLSLLQRIWPTAEQIRQFDHDRRNALKMTVEILALSILHNYAEPQQRDDFLLACLNEEKKKHGK